MKWTQRILKRYFFTNLFNACKTFKRLYIRLLKLFIMIKIAFRSFKNCLWRFILTMQWHLPLGGLKCWIESKYNDFLIGTFLNLSGRNWKIRKNWTLNPLWSLVLVHLPKSNYKPKKSSWELRTHKLSSPIHYLSRVILNRRCAKNIDIWIRDFFFDQFWFVF